MSDYEEYVEPAATAIDPAAFDESLENYAGPVRQFRRDKASDQARAMLAVVGPLIAEDTRERMVEAAGRAVEREGGTPCVDCLAHAEALRHAADDLYSDRGPGNMLSTATWLRERATKLEQGCEETP